MTNKKAQEHTFLKNGKVFYNMISEDRIREIIREEIADYNEIFMSQMNKKFKLVRGEPWEDISMEKHGPGPDDVN